MKAIVIVLQFRLKLMMVKFFMKTVNLDITKSLQAKSVVTADEANSANWEQSK